MAAARPRWLMALWVCLGLLVIPVTVFIVLDPGGRVRRPALAPPVPAARLPVSADQASVATAAPVDGRRSIVGRVTDDDDRPIDEAEIVITGWGRLRTFSDADGRYRLRSVPVEELELVVSAAGFWEERFALPVGSGGQVERIDVQLERAPPVAGVVVDDSGKPVAKAVVSCTDRPGDPTLRATTDADGRFNLSAVAAGCRGAAKHEAHADAREVVLRVGDGNRLQLGAGGSIAGVVVDESGSPIERFTVAVESHRGAGGDQPTRGRGRRQDVVDPTGRFDLAGLPAGTYVLIASAAARPPGRTDNISLQPGEQIRGVRIVLSPGGTLRGVVRDGSTGAVIAGAVVVLDAVAQPRSPRAAVARTDEAGSYELPGAPAGPFSVRISARDYVSSVVPSLRCSPGGTTEQDFELRLRGEGEGEVEYTGIGARLTTSAAGVVIAMVVPGGPAAGAGLEAQDLILRVDGEDATGWTVAQAVQRLRGPAGTRVSLRVRRGAGEREVVIRRAKFAQ
ncbi:MAG: carboxypeptidase regulatory-like domain-containing protein [Deltaproteobacteria bacterium]|nr:carboxypeptidase regulatory-like domain-containing protein [Deltaproteobacteria bacterium]